MIARNENALICDMAEVYHIYDYTKLPPKQAAIFAAGLPSDSRINRELSGQTVPTNTILLASIVDALNTLVWFKTEDGQKGRNRPASVLERLTQSEQEQIAEFDSIEAYEAARRRIMES